MGKQKIEKKNTVKNVLRHPIHEHALRIHVQQSHRTYDREMFRTRSERRRHYLLRISNKKSVRQEIHISRVGIDMIKRSR